jgi:putative endonuclease
MYYVYILRSIKDGKLYIGKTRNLRDRFNKHEQGQVTATKNRLPVQLVFYEAFVNKTDAGREELFYKSGFGREALQSKLLNTLK